MILYNLQYQHDWTSLSIHTHSSLTGLPLTRPLISGLPPRRIYVHPDEQLEILKAELEFGHHIVQNVEPEWVLPSNLAEKWSLKKFAEVFDSINEVPPTEEAANDKEEIKSQLSQQWRGQKKLKRVLLATSHDDSTVVYYIVHDGIVKPRQN